MPRKKNKRQEASQVENTEPVTTQAAETENAQAVQAAPEEPELEPLPMNTLEQSLARGIPNLIIPSEYTPTYGRPTNPRTIRNLPAMFQTCWPSLPKYDGGWSLQDARNKGYRPVRAEEVAADDKPGRLWLNAYDIVDGFVVVGGSVLMIGHREQIRKRKEYERKAGERELTVRQDAMREAGFIVEDAQKQVEYSPLATRQE